MPMLDDRKSVIVLGAGAGHDYRMPLGAELQSTIHASTRVDDDVFEPALQNRAQQILRKLPRNEWNALIDAFRTIHRGIFLRRSIDDLLDLHRQDASVVLAGKLLIARTILDAERNSTLWFSRENSRNRFDAQSISDTWMMRLFRQFGRRGTIADFTRCLDNVTFITFNYDRCLEHFLIHAIQSLFPVAEDKAHEIVYGAEIIHPYGAVGKLPALPQHSPGVKFGDENPATLIEVANGLNTYTEQLADVTMVERIHRSISAANSIIFLGLHFHDPNMKVITPPGGFFADDIFATATHRSDDDTRIIRRMLGNMTRSPSQIFHGESDRLRISNRYTCKSIFDEHERSLQL